MPGRKPRSASTTRMNSPIPAKPYLRLAIQRPLRRLFDYRMPEQQVLVGQRVLVPFGGRTLTAFAIEGVDQSEVEHSKILPVAEILPEDPIPEDLVRLLLWAAAYYHHPPGEALALALPPALRRGSPRAAVSLEPGPLQMIWIATAAAPCSLPRAPKQNQALQILKGTPEGVRGAELGLPTRTLRTMAERGWLRAVRTDKAPVGKTTAPKLNADQSAAVATIRAATGDFRCLLLEGVTGSGKTEVYLHAIEECLQAGQQALALVPEIGLTPQILQRFSSRLPGSVTAIHSALGRKERLAAWHRCATGQADVLIGARSALFTPLPKLGLIIVDEEHDPSYKQHSGLRYSARDMAIKRAHDRKIPIVLGSATPSFETLANVTRLGYGHLRLKERAGGAEAPRWQLLNMRSGPKSWLLSPLALRQIHECVERDEQALVFINRRGFAPVLFCGQCGWIADCHRCDAHLTVHRSPRTQVDLLICHRCGGRHLPPAACLHCRQDALIALGTGTQRGEEYLRQYFPAAEILRIDGDKAGDRQWLLQTMETLGDGRGRVLVGTQMLAKGHDVPNLTLVVILDADAGLLSADFRAPERTAQIMTQVAGRSGRSSDRPGAVLVQTRNPEHPLLQILATRGYAAFARAGLKERQAAGLPPFSRMALVLAEGRNLELCHALLADLAAIPGPSGLRCWGPAPAPVKRRADQHRLQLILIATARRDLDGGLTAMITHLEQDPRARKVRWSVDVDPLDIS